MSVCQAPVIVDNRADKARNSYALEGMVANEMEWTRRPGTKRSSGSPSGEDHGTASAKEAAARS